MQLKIGDHCSISALLCGENRKKKSCIGLRTGIEHRFIKTTDKLFALHKILGPLSKKTLIIIIFNLSLENILLPEAKNA